MKVFELMTRRVFSCRPDDSLATAAGLMWDHDFGCVPVLAPEGQVIGMLTDRDVCMAAYTRGLRLVDIDVASVMSRRVYTCASEQTLAEAEALMRLERVRRAPVVDAQGRLLGILSLCDLAREALHQKRRKHGEPLDEGVATTLAGVSAPRASS